MAEMVELYYDLHIHSCLSPCGDDDMTPGDICAMAKLKGLQLIAVTDHNTGRNLPAVYKAAQRCKLVFIPGIEITTREEVHLLGYFPSVEAALDAGSIIRQRLPEKKNNPSFFGHQWITDADGNPEGEEDALLIGAADLSLSDTTALVRSFGGVPVPAHINRGANGILTNLGFIPEDLGFRAVEVSRHLPCPQSALANKVILYSSDAHYLGEIAEPEEVLCIEKPEVKCFLDYLRGSGK